MSSYRVFTVASGQVTEGAAIASFKLPGAGTSIPAILVGETGRGRELGVLPVGNPPQVPCPDQGKDLWTGVDTCPNCGIALAPREEGKSTRLHPTQGVVTGRLMAAEIGTTRAGRPKLFSVAQATDDDHVILVMPTPIGYRGGSSHTGDRVGWKCRKYGCDGAGEVPVPKACPVCGATGEYDGPSIIFADFPGEVLVSGIIAQGDAGRMGSGRQIVVLMSKGVVFRTSYSGRRYGAPGAHYYMWDGSRLLAATWEERSVGDLF